MFNFDEKPQTEALDEVIDDLLRDLQGGVGDEHEHAAHTVATDNLIKLMKLKMELQTSWRPSPDAIVAAVGSLASILLVMNHEKIGNIITSKAFSFVPKFK
jgi:hypothetical protein